MHGVGFHPDERGVVQIAEKLNWNNLIPESFHYGSFAFYLLFFLGQSLKFFGLDLTNYDGLFVLGRFISATSGTGCVVVTFLLAERLYGRRSVSLMAAAMIGLNAFAIQASRFYAVDMLLTFLSTLVLLFAVILVRKKSLGLILFCSMALAAAVTTKISGLSLGLALLVSYLIYFFRTKDKASIFRLFCFALAFLFFVFCFEPNSFLEFDKVYADNLAQIKMAKGDDWRPPYTIQYAGTIAFLYPLQQMWNYSMGQPLALAVFLGIMLCFFRQLKSSSSREELIVFLWVLVVFYSMGKLQVKFPRYLLPIYPALFVLAARGLYTLSTLLTRVCSSKNFRQFQYAPQIIVSICLLLFAVANNKIYQNSHSYKSASGWIYENIAEGANLLHVHWDDTLPVALHGVKEKTYRRDFLNLYDAETSERLNIALKLMAEGDYLIFPTKRFYGAITRVENEFPKTNRIIEELFKGNLGYTLVYSEKIRPSLGPFKWRDELGDESLSVYDHPKVLIFKKTGPLVPYLVMTKIQKPAKNGETLSRREFLLFE